MGDPMWKTSDGRTMPVAEMSDRHISNALRKCQHGSPADMLRAEQARRRDEMSSFDAPQKPGRRRKPRKPYCDYTDDELAEKRAELVKQIDSIDHMLIDRIRQEANAREAYANVDLDAADAAMDELDAVLG